MVVVKLLTYNHMIKYFFFKGFWRGFEIFPSMLLILMVVDFELKMFCKRALYEYLASGVY